jgi:hypothetical protein
VVAWFILKDSFLLPPSLGGKGSINNLFYEFPYFTHPPGYTLYFTGTMGFHLAALLKHLLAKKKAHDYVEMVFHHTVTIYLYGFSYLSNCYIGIIVAYLHDIADVGVSFTRIWSESIYKKTTAISFILTQFVWFHTRIYVLGYIIFKTFTIPCYPVGTYI